MNKEELIPGRDYNVDRNGRWVFTSEYLHRRGYCCEQGCQNCPYPKAIKLKPCIAPIWARSGHPQTLAGHFISSPALEVVLNPVQIALPDGDSLVVEHSQPKYNRWLVLFHGLGGESRSDYMRRIGNLAHGRKWNICLVNHRGAGLGKGLAKRPYHSGAGDDVSAVLHWLRTNFPKQFISAIGFSLSGSALLNLLAGRRGEVLPDRAIIVNAPLKLGSAADLLSKGWNRLYDIRFVKLVRDSIRSRAHWGVKMPEELVGAWWRKRLYELDDLYTAPALNLRDRFDYYQSFSSFEHLKNISTPTFVLTSEDDPFVDVNDYKNANWSKSTYLHIEPVGGHMGYISSGIDKKWKKRWLDYAIDNLFENWLEK